MIFARVPVQHRRLLPDRRLSGPTAGGRGAGGEGGRGGAGSGGADEEGKRAGGGAGGRGGRGADRVRAGGVDSKPHREKRAENRSTELG